MRYAIMVAIGVALLPALALSARESESAHSLFAEAVALLRQAGAEEDLRRKTVILQDARKRLLRVVLEYGDSEIAARIAGRGVPVVGGDPITLAGVDVQLRRLCMAAPTELCIMEEWRRIEGSSRPVDFENFLAAWPGSAMAPEARARLAELIEPPPPSARKPEPEAQPRDPLAELPPPRRKPRPPPQVAETPPPAPPAARTPAPARTAAVAPGRPARNREAVRAYTEGLHARLNRAAQRSYPTRSIDRGEEGVVPVLLTIGRDGKLLQVRVLDDTLAADRLVKAAVKAIQRSAPFPQFAADMGGEPTEFTVRINYSLR